MATEGGSSENRRRRLGRGELVSIDGALLEVATHTHLRLPAGILTGKQAVSFGGAARQARLGGACERKLAGGPCHRRGAPAFGSLGAFERKQHLAVGSRSPKRIGVGREEPREGRSTLHEPVQADTVTTWEVAPMI